MSFTERPSQAATLCNCLILLGLPSALIIADKVSSGLFSLEGCCPIIQPASAAGVGAPVRQTSQL
jgi:hypothetical protein